MNFQKRAIWKGRARAKGESKVGAAFLSLGVVRQSLWGCCFPQFSLSSWDIEVREIQIKATFLGGTKLG